MRFCECLYRGVFVRLPVLSLKNIFHPTPLLQCFSPALPTPHPGMQFSRPGRLSLFAADCVLVQMLSDIADHYAVTDNSLLMFASCMM